LQFELALVFNDRHMVDRETGGGGHVPIEQSRSQIVGLSVLWSMVHIECMETLWKILQVNSEWTRFLDAKAQALLAGAGVLGAFEIRSVTASSWASSSGLHHVVVWLGLILVVVTMLAALLALLPRVHRAADSVDSHLFYGSISAKYGKDFGTFKVTLLETVADDETLRAQLANQIWEVSRIAAAKSTAVIWATRMLGASLLVAGLASVMPGLRG